LIKDNGVELLQVNGDKRRRLEIKTQVDNCVRCMLQPVTAVGFVEKIIKK